ncbi:MAG: pyruvate kinase, partial [Trinickia sp.]
MRRATAAEALGDTAAPQLQAVQPVEPVAVPMAGTAAEVPSIHEDKATPARADAQPSPNRTSASPQAPDASSRSPFTSDTTQTRRYMHRATKIVATIGP